MGEGHFELRTLSNFRERLSRYMRETGINLLDQAFAQVTDVQIEAYQVKTGRQRMDSSPERDESLREKNVQQIQTAIRGRKPAAEKLHLSDFEIKQTEEGKPTQITCPQGQNVKVQR